MSKVENIKGESVFEKAIITTMKMDKKTWRRHASPWSVGTRFTCLPFICFAIWSREWVGYWYFLFLFLALLWTWLNPRIFNEPHDFDNWPAKVTFGECVWLNRGQVPIPQHHQRMAMLLTLLMILPLFILSYGLYALQIWPTLMGLFLLITFKIWFCDRMVWLYEEMKEKNAIYKSWLQKPNNDNQWHGLKSTD